MSQRSGAGGEGPGDLGRRVRERRLELGLSVSEVARRAGTDPGYLEYLEDDVASPSSGALVRLAAALETTADALAGGGIERPPGRGRAAGSPVLEELGDGECLHLLASGGVGRVVFTSEHGPAALPVNFGLLDGDIVFRTAETGVVAGVVTPDGAQVGFEVDRVDEALAEGWSVLAYGRAHRVGDDHELARVRGLEIEPWAGGERSVYVRVVPSELTGRRIRARR